MTAENAKLYSKLAAVLGGISRIPKNGVNKHFGYSFAQDSDVLDHVRALLAEHKIAVFVSMVDLNQSEKFTRATFEFTLACGETGAAITSRWTGEAADAQDKGINKAATAAMKYWLLKTFLISTGDDPDGGAGNGHQAQQRQQPAPSTNGDTIQFTAVRCDEAKSSRGTPFWRFAGADNRNAVIWSAPNFDEIGGGPWTITAVKEVKGDKTYYTITDIEPAGATVPF